MTSPWPEVRQQSRDDDDDNDEEDEDEDEEPKLLKEDFLAFGTDGFQHEAVGFPTRMALMHFRRKEKMMEIS